MVLGQKITVAACLRRRSEYRSNREINEYRETEFKEWVEQKFKEPKEVMVIGLRTLSQGYNKWGNDTGNVYYPLSHFSAVLVVVNLRSKPFFVLKISNNPANPSR